MPTFDAKKATCRIFTEKEGLLSRLAHDLELEVTDFQVTVGDAGVEGTFNPKSVKVLHALRAGRPTVSLSEKDKRDIETSLGREVLPSGEPIRFVSSSVQRSATGARIAGMLTLNGRTRPLELDATLQASQFVAEVSLHQPDFGIKPFTALMGSLKVRPDVKVRISLPQWE